MNWQKSVTTTIVVTILTLCLVAYAATVDTSKKTIYSFYDGNMTAEEIQPDVFAIVEPNYYQENHVYLVIGSEKALLIDSGAQAEYNIAPIVKELTNKPLIVLPTHLHFDHIAGLQHLSNIWLIDLPVTRALKQDSGLYYVPPSMHLGTLDGVDFPPFKVSNWLQDGSVIDLGDRQLTVYTAPGHTQDEIVIFDKNHNLLFTGDAFYPADLFSGNEKDYLQSTKKVLSLIDDKTVMLGAHPGSDDKTTWPPHVSKQNLLDIERALRGIVAKTLSGEQITNDPILKTLRHAVRYPVSDKINILTELQLINGDSFSYENETVHTSK